MQKRKLQLDKEVLTLSETQIEGAATSWVIHVTFVLSELATCFDGISDGCSEGNSCTCPPVSGTCNGCTDQAGGPYC